MFDLETRRKELNLTLEDVGKAVGVGKSTVKKWETGFIENMKRDKIAKLAEILKVSPLEIMGITDKESPNILLPPDVTENTVTFPVIGKIAAGYEKEALEDWSGETVEIPFKYLKGRNKDDFFVLKVIGDSMYPMYQEGDKVLVLKQSTLNYSGSIGAVMYNDNLATLKKVEYAPGEDWMRLVPINPNHTPKRIEGSNLENCRILGIPKLLIREISE